MRHIITLFLLILGGLTTINSKEYSFPPELESLISDYKKTEAPALPEPEMIERLDDKISLAPGRIALTRNIIINKRETRLYVVNIFGDTLATFPICCARNRGQKKSKDDCTTPEGTFSIAGVYNSTDWKYKGTGAKCYGPYFVSLITPGFWGIGIHGTNSPGSVPGRYSHGRIRFHNE
ncbi:MAG: L,D-transpeptidase, partial [Muribaculaceae bacterium]|nr:L,D-transpeptidase [Muribaculaceae bacterium]